MSTCVCIGENLDDAMKSRQKENGPSLSLSLVTSRLSVETLMHVINACIECGAHEP